LGVDSPYELNLSTTTAAGINYTTDGATAMMAGDAPFTVAELERVLRVFDADSGTLPKRLSYLSGVLQPNGIGQDNPGPQFYSRAEITTDSFDVPVPDVSVPKLLQGL